jgi:hypothetical protein
LIRGDRIKDKGGEAKFRTLQDCLKKVSGYAVTTENGCRKMSCAPFRNIKFLSRLPMSLLKGAVSF